MRLLDTRTLEIHEFPGDSDEEYAILSHRWGEEECTLQHMSMLDVASRKGYAKIKACCEQAAKDGLDWAWTSTAELSEALNSMFRWYQNAQVCYAYLDDVTSIEGLGDSLWLTRGWTLQELIAPKQVWFYSSSWEYLGSKVELAAQLQTFTGIEQSVLSTGRFGHVCVAHRMEWAARRTTTRIEDRAYCLMGIFDVNMPLIYGEGKKAFLRLQREIMKIHSDDQTLFAWGLTKHTRLYGEMIFESSSQKYGLFAASPADFAGGHEIHRTGSQQPLDLSVMYGNGLKGKFPVLYSSRTVDILILKSCAVRYQNEGFKTYVGIVMHKWSPGNWARAESLVLIPAKTTSMFEVKDMVIREPTPLPAVAQPTNIKLLRLPQRHNIREDHSIHVDDHFTEDHFGVDEVHCLPHATYSREERRISFPAGHKGPHAAIFFTPVHRMKPWSGYDGSFGHSKAEADFSFAIVVGLDISFEGTGTHAYAFVPILGSQTADADFHRIFRTNERLIRCCMTKEQLKRRLAEGGDVEFAQPYRHDHVDQLHRFTSWKTYMRGPEVVNGGETHSNS
ncbi:HET-domain-containing protein [Apiospora phragmitis]|uniref:HET-domain-containing protein n=1 Tax=Apiospora phragmitis TaxID=2905665 RepID=A0ABR1UGG0_9PEZI